MRCAHCSGAGVRPGLRVCGPCEKAWSTRQMGDRTYADVQEVREVANVTHNGTADGSTMRSGSPKKRPPRVDPSGSYVTGTGRPCAVCGTEMFRRRKDTVTCSPACRKRLSRTAA